MLDRFRDIDRQILLAPASPVRHLGPTSCRFGKGQGGVYIKRKGRIAHLRECAVTRGPFGEDSLPAVRASFLC